MSEYHSSAAVPLKSQLIKSLAIESVYLKDPDAYQGVTPSVSSRSRYLFHLFPTTYRLIKVYLSYLAACEASHGNDHF